MQTLVNTNLDNINKLKFVVEAILSQCDGAKAKDGVGFNKFDSERARQFLANSESTVSDGISVYRFVVKYTKQILNLGISDVFGSISFDVPQEESSRLEKESSIEIQRQNLLRLIDECPIKPILKLNKSIKSLNITNQNKWIWEVYNHDKSWFKEKGLSVYKNIYEDGKWQVQKWEDLVGNRPTPPPIEDISHLIRPDSIELSHSDKLLSYQVDHVKYLMASIKNFNAVLDASDTGCHKKGTDILMFDGSIKKVEDIVIGDVIMDWRGNAQTVTELKRGREQMFEIKPVKGDSFIVNKNHILTLIQTNRTFKDKEKEPTVIDIKVSEYITKTNRFKHIHKLFRVGVPFYKKELKLNPYFLGILLGDGYLGSEENSSIAITKNDEEIKTYCEEIVQTFNGRLVTTVSEKDNSSNVTYFFRECPELKNILKSLNLFGKRSKDKFIPFEYKTSSVEDRQQLLAGLLDTDGSLTNNGYDFISKSKTLSEDVTYIARSLGLSAYMTRSIKSSQTITDGEYWRVSINGEVSQLPLKIERKKPSVRKQIKDVKRTGFSVIPLDEDDYYGFSLDGDGRFLLGDFTVTHNTGKTFSALACAKELGLIPIVLTPKSVIPSWIKACKHFNIEDFYVTNYEAIKTGKTPYLEKRSEGVEDEYVWNLQSNTILIFDEVHRCKNRDTLNAKLLLASKKCNLPVICLSATIADNPTQLYAVGNLLDLYGNRGYNKWLISLGGQYNNNEMRFEFSKESLKKVNSQIFPLKGHRISIKDLGDLFPETAIYPETFTVSEATQKSINSLYDTINTALDSLKKKANEDRGHHLTELLRARQQIELLKIPIFVELAEDMLAENNSVVIIVNFTQTLELLAKKLNTKCVIHGSQTAQEREKNIADFQSDKERVIILNIRSGGVGVSLHDLNGNHPRFSLISPSWSAQDIVQAVGRVWRAGGKSHSIQKIVYCANTVEEDICETMKYKIDNINIINESSVSDVFASLGEEA